MQSRAFQKITKTYNRIELFPPKWEVIMTPISKLSLHQSFHF